DIRWVGNEKGIAGDPCWATYTPVAPDGGPPSPGNVEESEAVTGTRNGKFWMPAECDVSIRPGWFGTRPRIQRLKPAANYSGCTTIRSAGVQAFYSTFRQTVVVSSMNRI